MKFTLLFLSFTIFPGDFPIGELIDSVGTVKFEMPNFDIEKDDIFQALETANKRVVEFNDQFLEFNDQFKLLNVHAGDAVDIAGNYDLNWRDTLDLGWAAEKLAKEQLPAFERQWGSTNDFLTQISQPQNLGVLMAAAGAGAILGSQLVKIATHGIASLAKFTISFAKRKKELVWNEFVNAQKFYEKNISIRKELMKSLKTVIEVTPQNFSKEKVLENLDQQKAVLTYKFMKLKKKLGTTEGLDCVPILAGQSKLKRLIEGLARQEDLISKSITNDPCTQGNLLLVKIDEIDSHLEEFRFQLLSGFDLLMQKEEKKRNSLTGSFWKIFSNNSWQQGNAKYEKNNLIASLQKEVFACMDELGEVEDWEGKMNGLNETIQAQWGHISETDDFTYHGWIDWAFNDQKSLEKSYCEKKVYNEIVTLNGTQVKKIDAIKYRLAKIEDHKDHVLSEEKSFNLMKKSFATSFHPNLSLHYRNMKNSKGQMEQVVNDQRCYSDPLNCDQLTLNRVESTAAHKETLDIRCQ